MVDPHNPIKFDRTDHELEEWLIFSICVAGKQASVIAKKVDLFLADLRHQIIAQVGNDFDADQLTPMQMIRFFVVKDTQDSSNILSQAIEKHKLGRYKTLSAAFRHLGQNRIDLRKCSVEELQDVPGVGPKTARMFILHSRPNAKVAALDTHILAHLRELGYQAPKTTPSKSQYDKFEQIVLKLADDAGMTPTDYDLKVWKMRTKSKPIENQLLQEL